MKRHMVAVSPISVTEPAVYFIGTFNSRLDPRGRSEATWLKIAYALPATRAKQSVAKHEPKQSLP